MEKKGEWKCEICEVKYENKYYYSVENKDGELMVVNKENVESYAQWMEERNNGDKMIYWVMLGDKELSEWEIEHEREVIRKNGIKKRKE